MQENSGPSEGQEEGLYREVTMLVELKQNRLQIKTRCGMPP